MLIIVAWLSLVERCVRDAEVASSNLVATTKNTPSHMCEGVFQTVDKTLLASTPEAFFLFSVQKVCT